MRGDACLLSSEAAPCIQLVLAVAASIYMDVAAVFGQGQRKGY